VLAGEPAVTAQRNDKFIVTKQSVIGIIPIFQLTFRTSGTSSVRANNARQKAIANPRVSDGQTDSGSSCVKNPLELHKTDAVTTSSNPNHFDTDGVVILIDPSVELYSVALAVSSIYHTRSLGM
jgi:hypothetical protein